MKHFSTLVTAWVVLTAAVIACGRDPTEPARPTGHPDAAGISQATAIGSAVDQTVASVRMQPDSLLVIVGTRTTITAQVLNGAGEVLDRAVTWSALNASLVKLLTKGRTTLTFKARQKGTTTIRGTVDAKFGSTKLVIRSLVGATLVLTPASSTVPTGGTVQFAVAGRTKAGEPATVSATFTATGGAVSGTGVYTAGPVPGTYRVIATASFGAADTAAVTITSPPLTEVVVTPATVTMPARSTQQFMAYGRNALGDSIETPVSWTTTRGDIDGNGVYTASAVSGSSEVRATAQGTEVSGIAQVTTQSRAGPPGTGIPFGLFGMAGRELVAPYTSGSHGAHPDTILIELAAAKAHGARMFVNFSGGNKNLLTDADGHFDFDRWKQRVDRFLPIRNELNAYVVEGTLVGFMMIDEPGAPNSWGGQTVPLTTLDQMAQHSLSIFPDLFTAIRAAPTSLQGHSWRYLDMAWAQYTARKGSIDLYVPAEVAAAQAQGLGLVVGLNVSKGGDGSSGFGLPNEWSMSGAEILRYGRALLDTPYACAFVSWDSRASVIGRADVAAAMAELAAVAQSHTGTSCRQ